MDSGLKYSQSDFSLSKENLNTAAGYMQDTLSSASQTKSTIPSDFSMASSVSSAISEIEEDCSKKEDLSTVFTNWETLLDTAGAEATTGANALSVAESIKKIGTHIGAYQSLYGTNLFTDFHLGYNFVPGPNGSAMGGYVVYIPKNYNPSKAVGLSLIFHASGQQGHISTHAQAQKLANGTWEPDSIIIMPRVANKAYDIKAGTLSFPHPDVQNWIAELMENVMSKYNVDMNKTSVTGCSSSIRGAIEFAEKFPNYIKDVYVQGTLNVYDFENYVNSTDRAAVETIRKLSDEGVRVHLYTNKASISLYDGYENVIIHQTPGDHLELIANVENDPNYLAAIGGGIATSAVVDSSLNYSQQEAVTTPIDLEKVEDVTPVEEVTNNQNTTGATTNNESSANSGSTVNNSPVVPASSNSGSSGSSGHHSSSGSSGHSSTSNSSAPAVTTPVVETIPNILPENAYSTYIPELKTGEIGLMEISDSGVHYEINGVNDSAFSSYVNNLQNSGYILSGDGTVWMKDGNSILLTRNNDIMNIMFNMK